MKMNSSLTLLLILVASFFIIGILSSTPVLAAGPTNSGENAVQPKSRKLTASSAMKHKTSRAKLARRLQRPPTVAPTPAQTVVCYPQYWNGTGYSWSVPATSAGGSTQTAGSNVSPQVAGRPVPSNAPGYNVNAPPACYTWVPCTTQPAPSWGAPATAYGANSGQASNQAPPPQRNASNAPPPAYPPAVTGPGNATTLCYSGCPTPCPTYWGAPVVSACY